MYAFARLYIQLDGQFSMAACNSALVRYFRQAPPADAAWAVRLLTGPDFGRLVAPRTLARWASRMAQMPDWMLEACYQRVGNLVETATLLLPPPAGGDHQPLRIWMEDRLPGLQSLAPQDRFQAMADLWRNLDRPQRYTWNCLLTGTLRLKSADHAVSTALAQIAGVEPRTIRHRLSRPWTPGAPYFQRLINPNIQDVNVSRPYSYADAARLDRPLSDLGPADHWQAEWQWPGRRAQVIQRQDQVFIWTRDGALITERVPEIGAAAAELPDGTVVEGLLLAWPGHRPHPLPAAELERRLKRKHTTPKLLRQIPAVLMAYDLLEVRNRDFRTLPLIERRAALQSLLANHTHNKSIRLMPAHALTSWNQGRELHAASRSQGAQGLVLKERHAPYGASGTFWSWPPRPLTVTAMLIYAQPNADRTSTLYTFALRQGQRLVPVAKTALVMDAAQMHHINQYIKEHTHQRHGPVRAVQPGLLCEISLDAAEPSRRHKCGLAVSGSRVIACHPDMAPESVDSLEKLQAIIKMPDF